MIPFWPWSPNTPTYAKAAHASDPRLDPVEGDAIDDLVNEQLARGRDGLK